jgi:hypothetical protein
MSFPGSSRDDPRNIRWCKIWLYSVFKHAGPEARVTVLSDYNWHVPEFVRSYPNVEVVLGTFSEVLRPDLFLVGFRLHSLSRLKFPFLYLDLDAVPVADLTPLWDLRTSKPLILIDHQPLEFLTNPSVNNRELRAYFRLIEVKNRFPNAGVQLVGDPDFYRVTVDKLPKIFNSDKLFSLPGQDQALLYEQFLRDQYDYRHPDAGYSWNCWARTVVSQAKRVDGSWKIVAAAGGETYQANIVHFWGETKPWNEASVLYDELSQLVK